MKKKKAETKKVELPKVRRITIEIPLLDIQVEDYLDRIKHAPHSMLRPVRWTPVICLDGKVVR